MRRNAFSIVEVLIAVSLILMVAFILIPLNMANTKQAERIARWKNAYEEAKYSFELIKANDENFFNLIDEQSYKLDDNKIFNKIKPYLNIKEEKSPELYYKDYKYRFLNGRKVSPYSNFYVKSFSELESGVLIGFKLNDNRLGQKNSPFGMMIFDINGFESPNRFGQDVFGIYIYKDKIKAFGEGQSHSALKMNCSPIGTGIFCSQYYLIGGKF